MFPAALHQIAIRAGKHHHENDDTHQPVADGNARAQRRRKRLAVPQQHPDGRCASRHKQIAENIEHLAFQRDTNHERHRKDDIQEHFQPILNIDGWPALLDRRLYWRLDAVCIAGIYAHRADLLVHRRLHCRWCLGIGYTLTRINHSRRHAVLLRHHGRLHLLRVYDSRRHVTLRTCAWIHL